MACAGHSHDHDHEDDIGISLQSSINMSQVYCLNEHVRDAGKSILKHYVERLTLVPNLKSPPDADDEEDLELLLHVPFTEAVSIKTLSINGRSSLYIPSDGNMDLATSAPCHVKIFANRTDLDFDTARDLDADIKLQLQPPEHDHIIEALLEGTSDSINYNNTNDANHAFRERNISTLDYPLRPASKFRYCTSITLFFDGNFAQRMAESQEGTNDDATSLIPTEISYVGFKGSGTSVKRQAVECVYESRGMRKDHRVPGADYGAKESTGF